MPLTYLPHRVGDIAAHQIRVISNIAPSYPSANARAVGQSPYALKVVCSCQWEALAIDGRQATYYVNCHMAAHGLPMIEEVQSQTETPDGK
jgi:hypothetical protein